ncbi:hypothetical protein [Phenylobacterium sp. J367]|uniref:hypothetical protein n=1 Tax=Phenylobacterium sp. J367 TaxID=2898435 RepID=UPI0021514305|nr:hypothetical protein [Phenylobacterium sp. J367]MCR5881327.1 hypothetical protein [Phenylobacterium sp. J367]
MIVHTFGDGDWKDVLDHLRGEGLVDAQNAPTSLAQSRRVQPPPRPDSSGARPPCGSGRPAGRWRALCRRATALSAASVGPSPGPDVLRHGGQTPVSAYAESRHHRPALLAAISDKDGRLHRRRGHLSGPERPPRDRPAPERKTVGPSPASCAVRIDAAAPQMLVGEGLFTTPSASARFGPPAWALMSTRNPAPLASAQRACARC